MAELVTYKRRNKFCTRGHEVSGDNVILQKRNGHLEQRCHTCAVLRQRKKRYADKYLPPETETILTVYKEPLQPVKDGFGYMGTIAYDAKTKTQTQCHTCGFFFPHLPIHVRKEHGLAVDAYREKYRLMRSSSLLAPTTREAHSKRFEELTSKERLEKLKNLAKYRKQGSANHTYWAKSLEQKNRDGSCPDQLLDKIEALAKRLGRSPKAQEFRKYYGGYLGPVYSTFGSWRNALALLDMKPIQPKVTYYTREMVLKMVQDFYKMNSREPFHKDLREGHLPSQHTFTRLFGSFTNAKKEAGIIDV